MDQNGHMKTWENKTHKLKQEHQKQRTTEFSAQLLPTSTAFLQYLDLDHHLQTQMRKPRKHSKVKSYFVFKLVATSKT